MNNQELFDYVATHLLTQGRQSLDITGSCAYRSADGAKCAVGAVILDDAYDPRIEGEVVGDPLITEVLDASGVPRDTHRLLRALQDVHDNGCAPFLGSTSINLLEDLRAASKAGNTAKVRSIWVEGLREVARKFRLDASAVKVPE